ncbi:hypothetical protein JCM11251_007417 [Rhodosporidiobolus azoricus]
MASAAVRTQPEMPAQPPGPHRRRPSKVLASDYHLDVRQQPRQARMAGAGEKADRRPIDPPPIIRLRIRKPHSRGVPADQLSDSDLLTPTLTHTLFMFASLVPENSEEEMYDLTGSKSKLVAGSVVSSLFHLKDQSCFVFPDLSVRTEGRWRFKMSLFELGEDGVHFCTDILTNVFQVYSSKRFPGMGKSTELSKAFAQQGLKLRIRRPGSKPDDDVEEPAPRQPSRKGKGLRHPPNAPSPADHAPDSRRPSAPVATASPTDPCVGSRKRPWTSYDSGLVHNNGSSHPHHDAQLHPHPYAYAPYPPRFSHSTSSRAMGPPTHYVQDNRHAVPYSHAYPPSGWEDFSAHSHAPRLPTSSAVPYHPSYASSASASSSLATHPLAHSRSHASLSPSTTSTSATSASRHFPSATPALAHPLSHLHPHPSLHQAQPRRSRSPPPVLAPIRTFACPPSFPPLSIAPTPISPPPPAPARPASPAEYDAATVAAGAALASLAGRPTRATESSVRSTGSEGDGADEGDRGAVRGEEVEMEDAPASMAQMKSNPARSRGSLAMLLGGSGPDVAGDGEKTAEETTTVDFF